MMSKMKPGNIQYKKFFETLGVREWGIIGFVGVFAVLGLVQTGQTVFMSAKKHLGQVLKDHGGTLAQAHNKTSKSHLFNDQSHYSKTFVPRLGLSATVAFDRGNDEGDNGPSSDDSKMVLGELETGDRIIITTEDGLSKNFIIRTLQVPDWKPSDDHTSITDSGPVKLKCGTPDSPGVKLSGQTGKTNTIPPASKESIVFEKPTERQL